MTALEALKDYQQADEEGIMVLASRQAIDETVARVEALEKLVEAASRGVNIDRRDDLVKWFQNLAAALAAVPHITSNSPRQDIARRILLREPQRLDQW